MTAEEEKKMWLRFNIDKLIKANEILGSVRLYQFETEDKDKFIESMSCLMNLIDKYREKTDG